MSQPIFPQHSHKNTSVRSLSAPPQSGRTKKPTQTVGSQKRRDVKQAAQEPEIKKCKIRKTKIVDVTSHLKELLGLYIQYQT